jgi:hypothetical protein
MQIKKHLSFSSLRKAVSETFNAVQDWRQKGKVDISIHDAMLSGLACMYFQDPSLLQFQKRLEEDYHKNNLRSLFNVEVIPKETQMRDIIDKVGSEKFALIFKDYYQRLQRGKHLEQFQIFPSMYYFPIDGSQFFGSEDVHCKQCLTKEHNGCKRYEHHVLQGGIMHPDCGQIIPFMPEQIVSSDGQAKQDCEMNAAKRFLKKLKQGFPQLGLLIGGDALFSKQPIIEDALKQGMHYLFVAKPTDHKYMMEWLGAYEKLHSEEIVDKDGRRYHCEWMNKVPLNSSERSVEVNFLRCRINKKSGDKETSYTNSWVTDIEITEKNVMTLARAGRCRWKSENECFNVMKNHGYCMEHNYGHGQENLAFNFYLLTLLAFFMHQIFELTDQLYKACREKLGSKKHLWENLRSYIKLIVFDSWELLLQFVLKPSRYRLVPDTT